MQSFIVERLFDGHRFYRNQALTIDAGKVVSYDLLTDDVSHLSGTLVPGFIDVQVNGGGGALFNADPSLAVIHTITAAHAKFGTTACLPTLITDELKVMQQAATAMAEAVGQGLDGVLGIHFEGPHLSIPKKGVHSANFIRRISDAELAIFSRSDLGIKIVTLAPENVSVEVIKALIDANVKVCLGHSNADYSTVKQALAVGADGFTHLFNAMSAFTAREPGMVGAALECDNSWCGLIVDGHHVHTGAAKLALKCKPQGKIMLVTDAMPPVGLSDNSSFELFGQQVIRQGDRLNASTGELAGCVLDMAGAVSNAQTMLGLSFAEALRMASLYPAQYLGLNDYGHLQLGARADMVLLGAEGTVHQTYRAGELIYTT